MSEASIALLSRKTVARNRVYQVCLDHVRAADGMEVSDFVSVLPNTLLGDLLGGVSVLPLANGKVGLLRVWRHPLERAGYEIPRGFIDAGEEVAQAAARELHEETGLGVSAASLIPLGHFTPEAALLKARVALFAAELDAPGGQVSSEAGHSAFHWLDEADFVARLANGEIEDPATNIAWLRYSLARQR